MNDSERALQRILTARERLIIREPFYGFLALRLKIVELPRVETMATDAVHLFYNTPFVLSLSDDELLGVNVHEIEHCARMHIPRLRGRVLEMANKAADYAINPGILKRGYKLPRDILNDARFDGMHFEEIYDVLAKEERDAKAKADQNAKAQAGGAGQGQGAGNSGAPAPGKADPGNGSGQAPGSAPAATPAPGNGQGTGQAPGTGQGAPGQAPGTGNAPGAGAGQAPGGAGAPGTGQAPAPGNGGTGGAGAPGNAGSAPGTGAPDAGQTNGVGGIMLPGTGTRAECEAVETAWKEAMIQAANIVRAHGAGTMPGAVQATLSEVNAGFVDYRAELANFIDSKVITDQTWTRPNRRFAASGPYLPSTIVDGLAHLVFVTDSSGSIDGHMLKNGAGEAISALESGKVAKLTFISADTKVRSVQEFEKGEEILPADLIIKGGGGTRFSDSFRWIAENAGDASAIIYLTDMECTDWGTEPDCPVLWAIHGKASQFEKLAAKAPFGECVYVGRLER